MKESGIDWIGQIPEEWGVSRLKYYFDIYAGGDIDERNTVEEYSESHPYPVLSNSLENEGVLGYTNKYRFKKNCVTVTGRGDVGKAVYRNIKFYPVVRLLVCVPKSQVDCRFVTYWINSAIIEKNQTAVSQLTIQMLGELIFINVPFLEQKNIADFLDKKTAQLDKVKCLLEEQIQKLKDYRASLIYETVTKGLDKTVPLKDSGIDWIGQVPEGWEVGKVKYFSQISAGATPDRNNSLFWNGNINWMSSGEVNQGIVKHTFETITDLALKRTSTKLLPKGTVMLALNGQGKTKGTAAVLAIESASNQSLASFIVDNKILNNMYLYYFFVANYYNIRGLKGEDRDGLNLQLVSNIVIPLFEIEEQQKIVDFLDKKTVQIDQLIQIKNKQIDNINKQRQTLIYDYVTGKRRV